MHDLLGTDHLSIADIDIVVGLASQHDFQTGAGFTRFH